MQVQTELKPMFSYSPTAIVIIVMLIIITFILIKIKKEEKIPKEIIIPNQKNLLAIKKKYLIKLDEINKNLQDGKIKSRKAYQELSTLIRNFIYEMTNIKVQNYTLQEIALINMPILYELVSEYYNPEFAKISKGNIKNSLTKTRMVIEKWN